MIPNNKRGRRIGTKIGVGLCGKTLVVRQIIPREEIVNSIIV